LQILNASRFASFFSDRDCFVRDPECLFQFCLHIFLLDAISTSTMAAAPPTFDDQDWENFCLDPYQSAREEGERQGRDAGLEAGFRDGQKMGINTGTEYGMELGFFKGVCSAVEAANADNLNQNVSEERVRKTVADLRLALDDFPGPDQVFQVRQRPPRHQHDGEEHTHEHESEQDDDDDDDDDDDGGNGDSENAAAESKKNVLHKMQRIRARFKLLTVQLGMPNYSLTRVMDEAAATSATVTAPDTSDW
jgi:hypothetical protein